MESLRIMLIALSVLLTGRQDGGWQCIKRVFNATRGAFQRRFNCPSKRLYTSWSVRKGLP